MGQQICPTPVREQENCFCPDEEQASLVEQRTALPLANCGAPLLQAKISAFVGHGIHSNKYQHGKPVVQ